MFENYNVKESKHGAKCKHSAKTLVDSEGSTSTFTVPRIKGALTRPLC